MSLLSKGNTMALYINKDGQQLGPYSVAEAQTLLRSGTVAATDWAWQEGLPTWIPLHQIPGFVSVPPAPPVPPVPTATPVAYDAYKPAPPKDNRSLVKKIGSGIAAIGYIA